MGQEGHVPQYLKRGNTVTSVPQKELYRERPPQYFRSRLYLLISRHCISPRRIFYFNVSKEVSASGRRSPAPLPGICPWIPLADFHLLEWSPAMPPRGHRSTQVHSAWTKQTDRLTMEIPSCGKNNAGCCILPEHSSKDEYQKCDKCAPRDHKFVNVLKLTKQKQYPFFRQSRFE